MIKCLFLVLKEYKMAPYSELTSLHKDPQVTLISLSCIVVVVIVIVVVVDIAPLRALFP